MKVVWKDSWTWIEFLKKGEILLNLSDLSLIALILLLGGLVWGYYESEINTAQKSLEDYNKNTSDRGESQ